MTVRRVAPLPTLLAAVTLMACSSSPTGAPVGGEQGLFAEGPDARMELVMRDIRFEPSEFEVDRGALLAIDIENAADMPHDFTLERSDVVYGYRVVGKGTDPHGESAGPHVALRGGQRGELRMRFDEPGAYLFYCNVTGHRRSGMTGTITVR